MARPASAPAPCLQVKAAQSLGGSAFFDNEGERSVFVVDDLLVLEQLEEAVVGNVLDIGVGAAAEDDGETE